MIMKDSYLSPHMIQFIIYALNIELVESYSRSMKLYNQNIINCFSYTKPSEIFWLSIKHGNKCSVSECSLFPWNLKYIVPYIFHITLMNLVHCTVFTDKETET